jgi:hypothetical protein
VHCTSPSDGWSHAIRSGSSRVEWPPPPWPCHLAATRLRSLSAVRSLSPVLTHPTRDPVPRAACGRGDPDHPHRRPRAPVSPQLRTGHRAENTLNRPEGVAHRAPGRDVVPLDRPPAGAVRAGGGLRAQRFHPWDRDAEPIRMELVFRPYAFLADGDVVTDPGGRRWRFQAPFWWQELDGPARQAGLPEAARGAEVAAATTTSGSHEREGAAGRALPGPSRSRSPRSSDGRRQIARAATRA